jgi:GH24 family phage-related lysozyme (muramidase)
MPNKLTAKVINYVLSEEGLVLEAYKDGKGIWTVAGGVATTGGYDVLQHKDKPMPVEAALRLTIDLMTRKYLPIVDKAVGGRQLTEAQLAGMISFCWRHGAVKGDWFKRFMCGVDGAGLVASNWNDHGTQIPRAKREDDLIFGGVWPARMLTPVYSVNRRSYLPVNPVPTNLLPVLQSIMGGS